MSYTLFYAPATASLAVHGMLIELGVAFEAVKVDFDAGEQHGEAFLNHNPMGRVPALVIDGETYAESVALTSLLAERHPEAGWAPAPGAPGREKWWETVVYIANVLQPALRDWFYADKDGDPADADAVKRLALKRVMGVWDHFDRMLADGRPYLLGDTVTTADLLATMHMRWSRNMARPAASWPNLSPYIQHMRARPGFIEVNRREGLTEWLNP